MRMLSGEEAPDAGERIEGHNVVHAVLRAGRSDADGSGADRVRNARLGVAATTWCPAIRNILGGFLFSGDDVYKRVRVLSGGERTRLAVARMLLRPSNTLLLDEPTNHLDLDSKDVLLDALVDYGGTLIFVSHDRYFVERLATKIIEVGDGTRDRVPGHLQGVPLAQGTPAGAATQHRSRPQAGETTRRADDQDAGRSRPAMPARRQPASPPASDEESAPTPKRAQKIARRAGAAGANRRARSAHRRRRSRPSATSKHAMAAPGFYDDRAAAQPIIDRHQALMWEVGDLMHQWEELQAALGSAT